MLSKITRAIFAFFMAASLLSIGYFRAEAQSQAMPAPMATVGVIYEQPVDPAGNLLLSSWLDPDGSDYDQYIWDNFTLQSATTIDQIQWTGGYDPARAGLGGPVLDFQVSIYPSIAAGTEPAIANPPLVKYMTGGNASETLIGVIGSVPMYAYTFNLPAAFPAAAGVKYWVQIEAYQHGGMPDWGIAVGTGGNGSHYRRTNGAGGDVMYRSAPNDASFRLIGPIPNTLTPTATSTATNTILPPTATATNTALPPSNTPTATATNTALPPTATATNTALPPTATATATNTALPPTATATATNTALPPTATPTNTALPPTATATNTTLPPTATPTNTALPPTATATHTPLPPTVTATNAALPPTATPTSTATPTPIPNTSGKIAGGGIINKQAGKLTFGFTIQYTKNSSAPTGNLVFIDHRTKMMLKATSFRVLHIDGSHAVIIGYGTINDQQNIEFTLTVDDLSKNGFGDRFWIKIPAMNGYSAGGTLVVGNIQILAP